MKLENPLRPETGKKSIQAKEVYFSLVFQSLGFSPWVSLKDFFLCDGEKTFLHILQ